jgi:hypothetical protein
MRIEPGMKVTTNYSGPYIVKQVQRDKNGFTHLVCKQPDNNHGEFYLNYILEDEMRFRNKTYCGFKTVADYDTISIMDSGQEVQMTMF